jgi:hypothetical protein
MPEENIRELSRSLKVVTTYNKTPTSNTYKNLFEAVSAGCLQRIADSLEIMQKPYAETERKAALQDEEILYLRQKIHTLECMVKDIKQSNTRLRALNKQLKANAVAKE